jgi:hypothetical protein
MISFLNCVAWEIVLCSIVSSIGILFIVDVLSAFAPEATSNAATVVK